jgi:hypothetical protein
MRYRWMLLVSTIYMFSRMGKFCRNQLSLQTRIYRYHILMEIMHHACVYIS